MIEMRCCGGDRSGLVSETNKYLEAKESKASYKPLLLQSASAFVHRILKVFGVLGEENVTFEAGSFGVVAGEGESGTASGGSAGSAGGSAADEKKYAALLDVFSRFRDQVWCRSALLCPALLGSAPRCAERPLFDAECVM
jgi:hypothetical protein